MRLERSLLKAINVLARLFGALCVCVGMFFLVSAYAVRENRAINAVVGACIVAMGVAFLRAKSVSVEQLAQLKRSIGRNDS